MSAYSITTPRYEKQLPSIPPGWSWLIWEDVIDGYEKVFIHLRNADLRDKGRGIIDVSMYGSGRSVIESAVGIAERAGFAYSGGDRFSG